MEEENIRIQTLNNQIEKQIDAINKRKQIRPTLKYYLKLALKDSYTFPKDSYMVNTYVKAKIIEDWVWEQVSSYSNLTRPPYLNHITDTDILQYIEVNNLKQKIEQVKLDEKPDIDLVKDKLKNLILDSADKLNVMYPHSYKVNSYQGESLVLYENTVPTIEELQNLFDELTYIPVIKLETSLVGLNNIIGFEVTDTNKIKFKNKTEEFFVDNIDEANQYLTQNNIKATITKSYSVKWNEEQIGKLWQLMGFNLFDQKVPAIKSYEQSWVKNIVLREKENIESTLRNNDTKKKLVQKIVYISAETVLLEAPRNEPWKVEIRFESAERKVDETEHDYPDSSSDSETFGNMWGRD